MPRRFPRASGDGPLRGAYLRGADLVSPARAGMVPKPPFRKPALTRFPRASGDGPKNLDQVFSVIAFPPRERGWSPAEPGAEYAGQVSPARAGMVPRQPLYSGRRLCFPRASGDGPGPAYKENMYDVFPPRERGWSRAHPA